MMIARLVKVVRKKHLLNYLCNKITASLQNMPKHTCGFTPVHLSVQVKTGLQDEVIISRLKRLGHKLTIVQYTTRLQHPEKCLGNFPHYSIYYNIQKSVLEIIPSSDSTPTDSIVSRVHLASFPGSTSQLFFTLVPRFFCPTVHKNTGRIPTGYQLPTHTRALNVP